MTPSPSPHMPTILVVDDEPQIQALICKTLAASHYKVLSPRHAAQASHLCAHHHEPIHLLITDVLMPDMHGYELASRVKALLPDIQVLYITGFDDSHLLHRLAPGETVAMLRKPFTMEELLKAVQDILALSPAECERRSRAASLPHPPPRNAAEPQEPTVLDDDHTIQARPIPGQMRTLSEPASSPEPRPPTSGPHP